MAITLGTSQDAGNQNLFFQLPPYLEQLAGGPGRVNDALGAGMGLAREFFPFNSLGRIDTGVSAGQVSGTPGELGTTVSDLRRLATQSEQRTPEAQARLNMLQGIASGAQQLTPEEQQILAMRQDNLRGMTQEEEVMLRERAMTDLNRGLNTALRGIRSRFPGATGAASSIAADPVVAQYADQQRQVTNDLAMERLNRAREALNAYENSARGIRGDQFGRTMTSADAYNQASFGQQQFEAGNRANAYNQLLGAQQYNAADSLARQQFNIDQVNKARQEQLAREQFNLQQLAAEKSGQLGLLFGAGQFGAAEQGRQDALQFGREQLASAERQAAASRPVYNYSAPASGDGFGAV